MPLTDLAQLEVTDVIKSFGGTVALDNVSIGFEQGQVSCIIGPNGAGKTTLFNVISGFTAPDRGQILYRGQPINGLPPHTIARRGIGRLFQDVRVFPKMTLLENILVAHKHSPGENPFAAVLWPWVGGKTEARNLERAREHLHFVGLIELADTWAERISHGQQKLLAIARLLNNDADCLLLDEPTSGVNPAKINELLTLIRKLANLDKTVVVIEHNLNTIRQLGDWVYLLDDGRLEAFGTPDEILRDSALARLLPSY